MAYNRYMGIWGRCLVAICVLLACPHALAGYTHYWTWKQAPDAEAVKQCLAEMALLIEARTNIIAGTYDGESPLVLDATRIDFNGIGEEAHEPFVFPGPPQFNFCKTAYKPYDEVVTACLIVARDHFPAKVLEIGSDGRWEDWEQGAKLYSSVLKRPARNPMSRGLALYPSGRVMPWVVVWSIIVLGMAIGWYRRNWRRY